MEAPASPPEYEFEWAPSAAAMTAPGRPSARIIDNISPPLIAMFAVVGAAFVIVVYARLLSRQIRRFRRRLQRWRRCRRLLRTTASDFASGSQSQSSPPPPYPAGFPFSADSYSDHLLSPYGLDEAAIKTLPLSLFSRSKAKLPAATNRDCAVCLFEFEDGEWLRTLPICSHAFHVECIDAWLRSHATCPLCRAAISFRSNSPFVPMRAARIRPSFDDIILEPPPPDPASPIMEERGRIFLKRSYSFGFERSAAADRMVMEAAAATASPAWRLRYQQNHSNQHRGFWSKRWPSPFGGGGSARGFSSRPYYHRSVGAMKSPFIKRWGFGPLSSGGGGSGVASASSGAAWGRRSRSMTSPSAVWLGRPSGAFSSSRMRCGDPEALLSPERFNRR